MRLRISGARVVDPANDVDRVTDVTISDGRVQSVGKIPDGFDAERVLDASGLVLIPGIVDLRARLREPGAEHKATIASETRAAARGGITTLCCPPDTDPIIDTPAVAELIHQRATASGQAKVEVLGALTRNLDGRNIAEMGALKEAGCLGVSNAMQPVSDTEVMRRAMEYAGTFGLTVFVNAEDPWLAEGRLVHDGAVGTRLGLPGIPEIAESIGVARELLLVEQTGTRTHFCHLSTGPAVDMVRDARSHGLPVSADVAIHQLLLTEADVGSFDGHCHVRPPLRSLDDRARLRAGVRAGVLGSICSDHQPHELDAKLNPFSEDRTRHFRPGQPSGPGAGPGGRRRADPATGGGGAHQRPGGGPGNPARRPVGRGRGGRVPVRPRGAMGARRREHAKPRAQHPFQGPHV